MVFRQRRRKLFSSGYGSNYSSDREKQSHPLLVAIAFLFACSGGYYAGSMIDEQVFKNESTTEIAFLNNDAGLASDEQIAALSEGDNLADGDTHPRFSLSPRHSSGHGGKRVGASIFNHELWQSDPTLNLQQVSDYKDLIREQVYKRSTEPGFELQGISGSFDLSRPNTYLEFGMGGDTNGQHVLRVMADRALLLYEVQGQDRMVLRETDIPHISGEQISLKLVDDSLRLSGEGREIFSMRFGPGQGDIKQDIRRGRMSFCSNLKEDEIRALQIESRLDGADVKDIFQ